jgi:predicted AAA+ superfamily ATPase
MDRLIEKELLKWKDQKDRLPLIVRGARQVGKSFTIEKFGKENFNNVVTLNFEFRPSFSECFESLDPDRIVSTIELMTERDLTDGNSLLFLDEIQQCPKALLALRYFKEKRPHLHVIAAGSLLEFALKEEDFSFPVGRVTFLYMRPLSFIEFLFNAGYVKLLKEFENVSLEHKLDRAVHEHALRLVREYMLVGGMPAAVKKYIETKSFLEVHRIQSALLESYRNDFGKYASKAQFKYLQKFFDRAPFLVGQTLKYVKVDQEARPRELKVALDQLCWTGLINRVFQTSANGIPLQSEINEKKFKLVFLDIGLMQNANKIDPKIILNEEIWQQNEGALAEQLVGQQLLAEGNFYENTQLYYWEREKVGSTAEVDYVTQIGKEIVPIEVKAGTVKGHIKSLQRFLSEKQSKLGIRISQNPLDFNDAVINLPFYLIDQMKRLVNLEQ